MSNTIEHNFVGLGERENVSELEQMRSPSEL